MAWRTWALLSPEEHARRRKLLRLILIIQAGGLAIGGTAAFITTLMSPSVSGLFGSALPFVMVGLCWFVYRLSERHWYGSTYLYSFITVLLKLKSNLIAKLVLQENPFPTRFSEYILPGAGEVILALARIAWRKEEKGPAIPVIMGF